MNVSRTLSGSGSGLSGAGVLDVSISRGSKASMGTFNTERAEKEQKKGSSFLNAGNGIATPRGNHSSQSSNSPFNTEV